ncbi:hypothetical protein GALMADRAFT_251945 [Galerina marginata CBS 339.88]|uniref:F-box domain-containing protein n=1 Tax=Galerina marginata (strain CBS 339.88) TaxID=685588 RepID=A0A067T061_GALM3|nr:hypothetical protein GALMADRAFT_251945 [Galerina marginata CBS 339.88]
MDTLPTELHAYIFQSACSNEGVTIRALNTVSKYFCEVSRPYLYRNISISGPSQITRLLDRLQNTPIHLRHIHHLFLSDVLDTQHAIRLSDIERSSITRIITLSSPTLRTFSLVASSPFSSTSLIACVFRTSFPHLQSLTISGFYPFPSSAGRFPSLTHLHLEGNRNPQGLFQMSALEDAFPSLAELKVSGLGAAGAFLVEVEEALAGGEIYDGHSDCMTATRLPPSVRRLIIQAGPEPSPSASLVSRETAAMKDFVMIKRLVALKSRKISSDHGVELSILDRSVALTSVNELREGWLRRLTLET